MEDRAFINGLAVQLCARWHFMGYDEAQRLLAQVEHERAAFMAMATEAAGFVRYHGGLSLKPAAGMRPELMTGDGSFFGAAEIDALMVRLYQEAEGLTPAIARVHLQAPRNKDEAHRYRRLAVAALLHMKRGGGVEAARASVEAEVVADRDSLDVGRAAGASVPLVRAGDDGAG